MSIDCLQIQPQGDKQNSEFFEEYRLKIYQRRQSAGLDELLGNIRALVVQVESGDGMAYLGELYLMSPYRFTAAFKSATHRIYVLTSQPEYPRLIVMEPLDSAYFDELTMFNRLYPLASKKRNARYVGEVFQTTDVAATRSILESHNVRFHYHHETKNPFYTDSQLLFSFPSDYTCNRIGYSQTDIDDFEAMQFGEPLELDSADMAQLEEIGQFAKTENLDPLIMGVDHMATRVLSGEREDAILEFLTMSHYYFWGAFNIAEMNSSTNVNRNGHVDDDKLSPAKVFTANNTPSFVNSFENRPMPTEDFVRNFGRRMHHIAYEVQDGDHRAGEKNVDYVVRSLSKKGVPFLAKVVGE